MAPFRKNAKTTPTASEISIELDKTDVCAGETLNGKVKLSVREAIPARGVRLELHGYEMSIRHSGMGRTMSKQSETAVWFDDEITLFGAAQAEMGSLLVDVCKGVFSKDHYPVLEQGEYSYDFSYQLPDRLPGDYESSRGDIAIRYDLHAYVDIPLRVDINTTKKLTVYETVRHSDDDLAASVHVDKKCLLQRGGHVGLAVGTDRHGYKLGDDIQLTLDIDNKCSMLVECAVISLKQVETVLVHGEAEERETLLAQLNCPECKAAPNEKQTYQLVYHLSSDLYPTIEDGRLIKVSYALKVELEVDFSINPAVEIPIRLYEDPGLPGGEQNQSDDD